MRMHTTLETTTRHHSKRTQVKQLFFFLCSLKRFCRLSSWEGPPEWDCIVPTAQETHSNAFFMFFE